MVYNPFLHKKQERFQISDQYPLLQELTEDLSTLLRHILERKGLEWQRRNLSKDELSWLEFMFSNHTKKTIRSYHTAIREALEGHQDKDHDKTILMLINFDRNPAELIRSLDTKINRMWENILMKYHDVKDVYPYNLMLRHTYPQL